MNYTLRRIADVRFQEKCPVTILRSTDAGRTWDLWSEIPYAPDPQADAKAAAREGFTEPYLLFMPDGSALCLLRTTDGEGVGPLYWTRSTDNGRTWTNPALFDDLGVWPQMLTLNNGAAAHPKDRRRLPAWEPWPASQNGPQLDGECYTGGRIKEERKVQKDTP